MEVIFYIMKCIFMFLYKYQIYIASVITLIAFCSIIFRIMIMKNNTNNIDDKTNKIKWIVGVSKWKRM